jgi:tRNA nucleotidyltransferase (CCA-adding enzyme)
MPDYIYLLENRLTDGQQQALRHLRAVAHEANTLLFLTGDAVRDLTRGQVARSLEVTVHGSALKLKKSIEKFGGKVWGEDATSRALYLCFPGKVYVDLVSAHRTEYPKSGKSVFHSAPILDDLRNRDFTVNAMAISLNEGSYGLLMDPMNGVADIESQTLRLVSNYGFLEEPSRLIRATRYRTRLGWEMDPRTYTRYENAREEGVIEKLSEQARSYELEQIAHEEEGLEILRALEADGWMKFLFPAWTVAKADEEKLAALHELAAKLLAEGIHADISAAQMRLLTAKLSSRDLAALKKLMLRPGFVEEWNSLDTVAEGFAKVLLAKENATPSTSFKLFTGYDPEAVLWLGFTSKDPAVREHFNFFFNVWPEVRQRLPFALMQEMRITPELPAYSEIVQAVFLEMIDGKLASTEEVRAFLEPYSPPAPPPKTTGKRSRAKREKEHDEESSEHSSDDEENLEDIDLDGEDLPSENFHAEHFEEPGIAGEDGEDEEEEEVPPAPVSEPVKEKHVSKRAARPKRTKVAASATATEPEKAKEPAPLSTPGGAAKPEPKPTPAHPKKTGEKAARSPAKKAAPKVAKKHSSDS